METLKYTDSQINAVLAQAEADTLVPQLHHEHGVGSVTSERLMNVSDPLAPPIIRGSTLL